MKRVLQISLAKPPSPKRKRRAPSVTSWKPIALTWRRASRATRPCVLTAGGAVARHNWSARFNLHIHLAFDAHAPTVRSGARVVTRSPIMWRQSHAHFTSLHMRVRSALPPAARHFVNLRLSEVATHERSICAAGRPEIGKVFRAYIPPAPARSIGSIKSSAVGPGPNHGRVVTETATLTHHMRSSSWSRHRTTRLTWRMPVEQQFGQGAPPTVASAFRAPDLVWRTGSQAMMVDALERSIGVATSAVAPSGAARTPQFEQSAAPMGISPVRTLDPALIDRVADDVIGRVERRIRIERERRGV